MLFSVFAFLFATSCLSDCTVGYYNQSAMTTALSNDTAKAVRLLKEERLKRVLWKRYQTDPLFWLEDRFGEDPKAFAWSLWGDAYSNHPWDGDKDPIASAWYALANSDWVGVESATGTGKTYSLARVVFWFLDCFENSLVVTTAPKESQLKLHLWTEIARSFGKFKRIRPYAELLSLRLLVDARTDSDKLEDETAGWQAVGFVSGVGANEQSATKAQGFHREHMLIITEETPGVGLPVMTAFENTCTGGHNLIYALGNPDNQTDTLRTFCKTKSVKSFRVSALDFPNIVLGSELVKGAVTNESIERRIDTYGLDSDFYKSRVRGISPEQSTDSLIRLEWIEACCIEEEVAVGVGAVGIDVSNSETGDKAALAFGRGNTLVDLLEFQCPNATHLAYNLLYTDFELAQKGYLDYKTPKLTTYGIKPNHIGIDGVGVGVSTVNAFHDKGKQAVSLQGGALVKAIPTDNEGKPLYGFLNLRSQMYWALREDLRNGTVRFALRSKQLLRLLISELVIPKFEQKVKIAVESKDNIKKRLGHSPNLADAVVYWNWIRKGYYQTKKVPLPFGT